MSGSLTQQATKESATNKNALAGESFDPQAQVEKTLTDFEKQQQAYLSAVKKELRKELGAEADLFDAKLNADGKLELTFHSSKKDPAQEKRITAAVDKLSDAVKKEQEQRLGETIASSRKEADALSAKTNRSPSDRLQEAVLRVGIGVYGNDISELLKGREILTDLNDPLYQSRFSAEDRKQIGSMLSWTNNSWNQYKATALIASSQRLDDALSGGSTGRDKVAYDARKVERQQLLEAVSTLSPKELSGSALEAAYDKLSRTGKGKLPNLSVYETNLEMDIGRIGESGWKNPMMDHDASGKVFSGRELQIVPHQRVQILGGGSATGDTFIDQYGPVKITSGKQLLDNLDRATTVAPGVYLRHKGLTEFNGNVADVHRNNAQAILVEALGTDSWIKTASPKVVQDFQDMTLKLQAKYSESFKNAKTQEDKQAQTISYQSDLRERKFNYVQENRKSGKLQLSVAGETAFRELEAIRMGVDQSARTWNNVGDAAAAVVISIAAAPVLAPVLGLGASAGALAGEGATIVLGEEAAATVAGRLGVWAVSQGVRTLVTGQVLTGVGALRRAAMGDEHPFANWRENSRNNTIMAGLLSGVSTIVDAGFARALVTPGQAGVLANTLKGATESQARVALFKLALKSPEVAESLGISPAMQGFVAAMYPTTSIVAEAGALAMHNHIHSGKEGKLPSLDEVADILPSVVLLRVTNAIGNYGNRAPQLSPNQLKDLANNISNLPPEDRLPLIQRIANLRPLQQEIGMTPEGFAMLIPGSEQGGLGSLGHGSLNMGARPSLSPILMMQENKDGDKSSGGPRRDNRKYVPATGLTPEEQEYLDNVARRNADIVAAKNGDLAANKRLQESPLERTTLTKPNGDRRLFTTRANPNGQNSDETIVELVPRAIAGRSGNATEYDEIPYNRQPGEKLVPVSSPPTAPNQTPSANPPRHFNVSVLNHEAIDRKVTEITLTKTNWQNAIGQDIHSLPQTIIQGLPGVPPAAGSTTPQAPGARPMNQRDIISFRIGEKGDQLGTLRDNSSAIRESDRKEGETLNIQRLVGQPALLKPDGTPDPLQHPYGTKIVNVNANNPYDSSPRYVAYHPDPDAILNKMSNFRRPTNADRVREGDGLSRDELRKMGYESEVELLKGGTQQQTGSLFSKLPIPNLKELGIKLDWYPEQKKYYWGGGIAAATTVVGGALAIESLDAVQNGIDTYVKARTAGATITTATKGAETATNTAVKSGFEAKTAEIGVKSAEAAMITARLANMGISKATDVDDLVAALPSKPEIEVPDYHEAVDKNGVKTVDITWKTAKSESLFDDYIDVLTKIRTNAIADDSKQILDGWIKVFTLKRDEYHARINK